MLLRLLTVINELFIASDASDCAFLIPKDMSAVCDTGPGFLLKMSHKAGRCHKRRYHKFQIISMMDNFLL